jgi:hypothetical protein
MDTLAIDGSNSDVGTERLCRVATAAHLLARLYLEGRFLDLRPVSCQLRQAKLRPNCPVSLNHEMFIICAALRSLGSIDEQRATILSSLSPSGHSSVENSCVFTDNDILSRIA